MRSPERRLTDYELSPFVEVLARKFVNRWDMYPMQLPNGRWKTVHEQLHVGLLFEHLRGEKTLGSYLLNAAGLGRFLVLDADDEGSWQQIQTMAQAVLAEGVTCYLEQSRRGGHVWLFLKQRKPGKEIRQFAVGLLAKHGIEACAIEIFPKQDELGSGPGSSIRLPLGVHLKSGERYPFFLPDGTPLAPTLRGQLHALGRAETVPKRLFAAVRRYSSKQLPQSRKRPRPARESGIQTAGDGGINADQLKAAIDIHAFIGQYVELSPAGSGLCPFHDDHHPSFSVNADEGYWHCFACNIGGSVIDFWMRWHECDFKTAVKELHTGACQG